MEFLSTHAKEKADMILEPMQVMIQHMAPAPPLFLYRSLQALLGFPSF